MLRKMLPLALVALALGSHAAPLFGPEYPVSRPVYGAPAGQQRAEAVATDGNDFVIAWNDQANERAGLYVSKLTAAGALVQQTAVRSGVVRDVSIVWAGDGYLVAWNDDLAGTAMLARLSRQLEIVMAPQPMLTHVRLLAFAGNGNGALAVYTPYPDSAFVANLLDSHGAVLHDHVPLPLGNAQLLEYVRAVADGHGYTVFWRSQPQGGPIVLSSPPPPVDPTITESLFAAHVDFSGSAGERHEVIHPGPRADFGVAYANGKFGIDFLSYTAGGSTLQPFLVDATTFSAQTLPPVTTAGFGPAVVARGSDFVAYWMDYTQTLFALMTLPFGATQPKVAIHQDALGTEARLLWNGRSFVATWTDRTHADVGDLAGDVVATTLDAATQPVTPIVSVATAPAAQHTPAIAASGSESLAVWVEQAEDHQYGRVLATRVGADGSSLDATPIDLGAGGVSTYMKLHVAANAGAYYVVWQSANDGVIHGRRVARDGTLGALTDFGTGSDPAVAASATQFLVAYVTTDAGIRARRLNGSDGSIVDTTPLALTPSGQYGFNLDAASNGTDFLVVWSVGSNWWQFPAPNKRDTLGARVLSNGTVNALDIATGPADQLAAAVASDGRDYLVIYVGDDVSGKRVLANGQLAGSTPSGAGVLITHGPSWQPAVAGDAGGYAVLSSLDDALTLVRLTNDATVRETSGVGKGGYPGLASANGALKLTYARFDGGSQRVFVRATAEGVRPRPSRH